MTAKPLTKQKSIEKKIDALLHTSWDLVTKRNSELKILAEEALMLAEEIGNLNYKGLAMMELAMFECLVNNNYFLSIKLAEDAFALLKGRFRRTYEPYYHLNVGRNYHFTGDNVRAQNHYLSCVKLLSEKKDKNYYEKKWLAHAHYNMFILFNYVGAEFTEDENLYKAFALYEEIGDKSGIGNCYNSYAVYYFKINKFTDALDWLLKALALAESDNAISLMSIYCANIGLVYAKLGNETKSLHYFKKAQSCDLELKSAYNTAHTSNQLGEAFLVTGKYDAAILQFKESEKYFSALGVKRSLSNLYDHISEAYALTGAYENAYDYKKKYAESLKDVFNEEKTFAIAKARNAVEFEKKEEEAKLLRKKNAEIEKYAHELEISNNELNQFAHVASHDLREPLRMVTSYISLLKRSLENTLTADQLDYMKFITDGTHTMHALIGDLLTLSAISYVKVSQPVDLNDILKKVIANLTPSIKENNAQIKYPLLPVLQGDETHMLQLFQNLISNALKYNMHKIPVVEISYLLTGRKYQFTISDNGIGIPSEFRSKIFLIFQRLHSRDEFSGTGIGLAICKKIIDQAEGKIWVTGNSKGGSDFIFTLPAKQ